MDEDGNAAWGEARAEALVLVAVVGSGAHFDEARLLESEAEFPDSEPELDYQLGEEGKGCEWVGSLAWWFGCIGGDWRDRRSIFYRYIHCVKVVRWRA